MFGDFLEAAVPTGLPQLSFLGDPVRLRVEVKWPYVIVQIGHLTGLRPEPRRGQDHEPFQSPGPELPVFLEHECLRKVELAPWHLLVLDVSACSVSPCPPGLPTLLQLGFISQKV